MKKKKLSVMLLATAMTLSLAACGGKDKDPEASPTPTPTEQATEPSSAPTNAPENVNFSVKELLGSILDRANNIALMEMGETELKELYGIEPEKVEEFCVMVPMMNVQATEFAMFKAASADDVSAVTDGINKRLEALEATWGQYLMDQMELVENRKILIKGNYIFLIIAEKDVSDYAENVFLRQFDPSIEEYILLRKFDRAIGTLTAISEEAMTVEMEEEGKTYTFEGGFSEYFYVEGELAEFAVGDKVEVVFEDYVVESDSPISVAFTYLQKITD